VVFDQQRICAGNRPRAARIRLIVAAAQHARRAFGALLLAVVGPGITGPVALASSAVTGTVTGFQPLRGNTEQCVAGIRFVSQVCLGAGPRPLIGTGSRAEMTQELH
jgi:hypothetical protein